MKKFQTAEVSQRRASIAARKKFPKERGGDESDKTTDEGSDFSVDEDELKLTEFSEDEEKEGGEKRNLFSVKNKMKGMRKP